MKILPLLGLLFSFSAVASLTVREGGRPWTFSEQGEISYDFLTHPEEIHKQDKTFAQHFQNTPGLDLRSVLLKDDLKGGLFQTKDRSILFTDLNLSVKLGAQGAMAWVTRLSTGKPLPKARIHFYSKGVGEETETTNESGVAIFEDLDLVKDEAFSVVATFEGDVTFVNREFKTEPSVKERRASSIKAVTEKKIYDPGETVRLKLFGKEQALKTTKKIKLLDSVGAFAGEAELSDPFVLSFNLPAEAKAGAYDLDVGGLIITSVFFVKEAPVQSMDKELVVSLPQWSYRVGESLAPEVKVLFAGEAKVDVAVKLRLLKLNESQSSPKEVSSCEFKTKKDLSSCLFLIQHPGRYQVEGRALDSVTGSVQTFITGGSELQGLEDLELELSQKKIKLGEKLRLRLYSAHPDAQVLLTFERDDVLFSEVVMIKNHVLEFEKLLSDEILAPGFQVSATLNHALRQASVEVENPKRTLSPVIKLAREQLEPGEWQTIKVSLQDSLGNSKRGNLTIRVDETQIPRAKSFLASPLSGAENYQTLTHLEGSRISSVVPSLLTPDSSFGGTSVISWTPEVSTDSKGEYQVKLRAPEGDHVFRVHVFASGKEDSLGYAEASFKVSKALELEATLPSFLVAGDRLQVKARLTNLSGQAQDLNVEAFSDVLLLKDKNVSLKVEDGQSSEALFELRTPNAKEAMLSLKAQGQKVMDTQKYHFPVVPSRISHVKSFAGALTDAWSFDASLPSDAYLDQVSLKLTASTSPFEAAAPIFDRAQNEKALTWEQKLAKIVVLGLDPFHKKITELTQLKSDLGLYQTPSGGMSAVPGGLPDIALSVTTAQILQQTGLEKSEAVTLLHSYLKRLLEQEDLWPRNYKGWIRNSLRASILNALPETTEAEVAQLYEQRETLDLLGLTHLAQLQLRLKDKRLPEITAKLLPLKEPFVVQEERVKFLSYTKLRSVCEALTLFPQLDVPPARLHAQALFVLSKLQRGGWSNALESAACLRALSSISQPSQPLGAVSFELDGKPLLKMSTEKTSVSLDLSAQQLREGAHVLRSKGSASFVTALMSFETPFENHPRLSRGLELEKIIERWDPRKKQWVSNG